MKNINEICVKYIRSIHFPKKAKILVSGGTGFIGTYLVNAFLSYLKGGKVYVVSSRPSVDTSVFVRSSILTIVKWDNLDSLNDLDFIFHLASPTSSEYFVLKPVETIDSIYSSTKRLLDISYKTKARFVFASSMEVYGQIDEKNNNVAENNLGFISLQSARSSYPESKRLAELLCYCYAKELNVDTITLRLSCVFGPNINEKDVRICNYISECLRNRKDIILNTDGSSIQNMIFISDCICGILHATIFGKTSETYNITNPLLNYSVKDMCEILVGYFNSKLKVITSSKNDIKYVNNNYILNANKLASIGYKPKVGLIEGFKYSLRCKK